MEQEEDGEEEISEGEEVDISRNVAEEDMEEEGENATSLMPADDDNDDNDDDDDDDGDD